MKKSVGSFIALNRNLVIVLAILFGVGVSGVIAWQASAMSGGSSISSSAASGDPGASTGNRPTDSAGQGVQAPAAEPGKQDATHGGLYRGVSTAVRFDVSLPLRTLATRGRPVRDEREREEFEERPSGLEGPLGPQDIDKTVQRTTGEGAAAIPTPILTFDSTIGCGGCAPPDPNGEVGPNHFVAMGNTQFQIFNKTGTSLVGPSNINSLFAGFGGPCQTENAGDPVVLYDQLDDRWILTQFTAAGPTWFNCVAISTTPDPTGTYFRYAFTTGSNFPDYPKYGMWSDALYIATREFAGGSTFAGVGAYAINRAQLVAGNPAAQVISFLATPASAGGMFNVGDGLLPSDMDGMMQPPAGSPNYYLGSMDNGGPYSAPQDALTLWKFHADFATPANSTFTLANTIPVSAVDTIPAFCSGRACIPQPSTTNLLDHLGYRQRPLFRAAYRNFGSRESIVTNQSVEASTTMSGVRWYEIRSPNSSPVLFQDATYAPGLTDGIHRWMGSIAMDTVGNMALGYSASNSTTFPSSNYTGRLASDPVNTMPQGEASIKVGTGSQTGGGNRWGDYTDITVDPVDDCTFWYTNEYVPTTSAAGWRLTIGAFKFPSCSLGPSFSMSVTPGTRDICAPANGVYTVNTTSISGFTTPIALTATGNPAGTTVTFAPNPVVPGNTSTMTVSNTGAAAPGTYMINVVGTAGAITQNQNVTLKLTTAMPNAPTLTAPANGATSQPLQPTFTWTAATQAATYTIEIATDSGFTNIVNTASGLTTTTYSAATLQSLTQYFWRVRAINTCGTGPNSSTFSFTTALICIVPFTNPAPITINDNVAGSPYPSDIAVSGLTGTITKVTVTLTNMSHTFPDDVDIMVVGPGGQNTLIMSDAGGGGDITNLNFTFDDDAAATLPDATQLVGGTFKPSNYDTTTDVFPAPAPAPGVTVAMSVFNGTNPNGTWSLYVRDDLGADVGTIAGGWTVTITTACTGQSPTPTFTGTPPPTSTSTGTNTATATPTGSPCGGSTFSNPAAITINDNAAGSPYPSNIAVAGLSGTVTKVTVDLVNMSHTFPDDVDIMLVGPGGQNTLIMSDAGGGGDIVSLNFTFDDAAAAPLPDATQLVGGTFQASNYDTTTDVFPAPAPAPGATVSFSVFNGSNPNGTWSLYVRDDLGADVGTIAGGWTIHITTNGSCGPTATATATATGTPATATATATATGSPACTPGVLYDQTSGAGTNGTSSQDFETANDTFDDRSADDFVVPAGQTWTVQRVVANGLYFNGAGPAASFNVTFYADAATFPGAAVAGGTLTGASYTNAAGVFTITLPTPVILTSGTYWVSVQARMDFTPGGQWAWLDRTTTSNAAAVWQNPGGGFMVPACTSYARRGATCAIDAAAPDQVFQIVGSNGTGCPSPTSTSTGSPSPTPTSSATRTNTATPTPTASPCGSTFSYTGPAVAIPDNAAAGVNFTIPVSGVSSISDLNFTFDGVQSADPASTTPGINHSFVGDLLVKITSPGGTTVSAFDRPGVPATTFGCPSNNLAEIVLDDDGGFPNVENQCGTDTTAFPTGTFGPNNPLSAFDGQNANGNWTINISDNAAVDTGSARAFSLVFGGACTTGTPTLTATGTPATATSTPTATATPCGGSTFSNPAAITINDNVAGSPYPSNITVAGLSGNVTKVTVDLVNMSHTFPDDVDIMLVGPGGQNTLIMSDAGGGGDITSLNFTFDDLAAAPLPDATQLVGGTFQASNYDTTTDVFPAPAPAPGATVSFSVFNGSNPNGTWSLYVRDDLGADVGTIAGGWTIHISTTGGCGTATSTATATATPTATAGGTPSIQFSSMTYSEDESQTAFITMNRTGNLSGTNTVNFATSNGSATGGAACAAGVDYVSVNQAVTFLPNQTTQTVGVQICGDSFQEPTETVNLTLTGANVGSPSTAVLSINDTANSFRNLGAICTTNGGPGSPYPSTIVVSGAPTPLGSMRVTLYDVTHMMPDSMDFLLVGPGGQNILLMADAGGNLDLVNPVTLTFADGAGQVLPNSGPLTTGVFEATSWEPGQTSFIPPAPPAPYNEPGSTVGGTPNLASVFGPTNPNGTWSLYMRDDAGTFVPAAITGCVNGGWGLEFPPPTAANASISGRVMTSDGRGIRNAKVTITGNSLSQPIVVTTGSFGYFTFDGLATGETYVVTVNSQRYTFSTPARVISLVDNVVDADFIADPQE